MSQDPTGTKRQPPVGRYAAIVGVLIVVGLILAIIVGQKNENSHPSGASSPLPGASTGPSARY